MTTVAENLQLWDKRGQFVMPDDAVIESLEGAQRECLLGIRDAYDACQAEEARQKETETELHACVKQLTRWRADYDKLWPPLTHFDLWKAQRAAERVQRGF